MVPQERIELPVSGLQIRRIASNASEAYSIYSGGSAGIRTQGTLSSPSVFKTGAIIHLCHASIKWLLTQVPPLTFYRLTAGSVRLLGREEYLMATSTGFDPATSELTVQCSPD